MSIDTYVEAGRRLAEEQMTDNFTAYAPTEQTVDGLTVTAWAPQGTTSGKVNGTSVTGRDTVTRTVTIGGVKYPVIEGGLHIPLASFVVGGVLQLVADETNVDASWRLRCTALGPESDPALLDRWYAATNAPAKSRATARRLDVVEVPAPDPSSVVA